MDDEKKIAGSSYILSFFQEIGVLTHNYALFANAIIEFDSKYKSPDEISDADRSRLNDLIQTVRYSVSKSYILYTSICHGINKLPNIEIGQIYLEIRDNWSIKKNDVEKFVTMLNCFLIENVIQDLLKSSQDIAQSIFKQN